jgi:NADPH:quinone reductase-like Zn-dependent oxidoreductase
MGGGLKRGLDVEENNVVTMASFQLEQPVLITGATGFVGTWVVLVFLKAGYKVRSPLYTGTSFRDMSRFVWPV